MVPRTSAGVEASSEPPPRRGRGRRPADDVRADVLRTVGDLLLGQGLSALTIEGVAHKSGVSKTTIHKWWPSAGALALDGYFHAVENTLAFPDTGDIRADLTTQLHEFVHLTTRTPAGRLLTELIGRSQADPDLAAAFRTLYSSHRRALAVSRLEGAREAGQLRADLDLESVVDQLWGAIYNRLLVPDQAVNDAFADALVRNLFEGVSG